MFEANVAVRVAIALSGIAWAVSYHEKTLAIAKGQFVNVLRWTKHSRFSRRLFYFCLMSQLTIFLIDMVQ